MFLIRQQIRIMPVKTNSLLSLSFQRRFFVEDTTKDEKKSEEQRRDDNMQRSLISRGVFDKIKNKDKQTYLDMINIFEDRDIHRRGHVEFIYAALKNMEQFGVNRDLEVYKTLVDVLPKGKFIPTNIFQAEFMHYPKQQQCIIDLLEQMEDNGVIPDYEMEDILINIFGRKGHPVRKFWRMMYWMPKFKNLSPWLVPNPPPTEVLELAKLAVERMCSVDIKSKITIYETNEIESSLDETWIVSGQSPEQMELLSKHPKKTPLYIEGPFMIWLRNKFVNYFTLRGDPSITQIPEVDDDLDDVSNLRVPKMGVPNSKKLVIKRSIHEQDDGTIFALCVTGTSAKDSLLSWIRLLEKNGNPDLSVIPILFKFRSITSNKLVPVQDEKVIK